MRKLLLIGTLVTVSLGVISGVAAAEPRDFAVGAGDDGIGHFNFSAHQTEPLQASGHMTYRSPTQVVRADVFCLNVQGDLAFLLGEIVQDKSSGIPEGAERVAFEVRDAPGADAFAVFFANPALGCALPPFLGGPIVRGNIVVRDTTP
jgi:hypothetical protein